MSLAIIKKLAEMAVAALHLKRRQRVSRARRLAINRLHAAHTLATQKDIRDTLVSVFKQQAKAIAARAAKRRKKLLDLDEATKQVQSALLPVLAVRMAEAAHNQLKQMGVTFRQGKTHTPRSRKATSTATEWLNDSELDLEDLLSETEMWIPGTLPYQVVTELPPVMKERIVQNLRESFVQDYWREIAETTSNDANVILERGLQEGWSIRRMAQEMKDSLGGDEYAQRRGTLIARTESAGALNGARLDAIDDVHDALPEDMTKYIQKEWLSVLGTTTRPAHAALDGVPADEDGMWDLNGVRIPYPGHIDLPAEDRCNCFPAGTIISGDFEGVQRGWYSGAFAEIITKSGCRLTTTANHPIVTAKGLVPARLLNPGDNVLTYALEVDPRSAGSMDVENKPAAVEDVFEAFMAGGRSNAVKFPGGRVTDFYGDGTSIKGEIDIVRADWKLLNDGITGRFEKLGNTVFVTAAPGDAKTRAQLVSSSGPTDFALQGVTCPATSIPSSPDDSLNVLGRFEVTPSGSLAIGVAANLDIVLPQYTVNNSPSIAEFLCQTLERYPTLVSLDEVISVRHFDASCHVYDLQSKYGLVVAYDSLYARNCGIMSANCQCTLVTTLGMGDDTAQELIQDYYDRQMEAEEAD